MANKLKSKTYRIIRACGHEEKVTVSGYTEEYRLEKLEEMKLKKCYDCKAKEPKQKKENKPKRKFFTISDLREGDSKMHFGDETEVKTRTMNKIELSKNKILSDIQKKYFEYESEEYSEEYQEKLFNALQKLVLQEKDGKWWIELAQKEMSVEDLVNYILENYSVIKTTSDSYNEEDITLEVIDNEIRIYSKYNKEVIRIAKENKCKWHAYLGTGGYWHKEYSEDSVNALKNSFLEAGFGVNI